MKVIILTCLLWFFTILIIWFYFLKVIFDEKQLFFFNISGIYAFCNKSDCEGYYSVGNSYDICQLFKLIKPFYTTDININKSIKQIEKVLASVKDMTNSFKVFGLYKKGKVVKG